MNDDKLHIRIREARINARLNQSELASKLHLSPSAVTQWEATDPDKRTTPRRPRIRQIAAATGVDPFWLETGRKTSPGEVTPYRALSPSALEHLEDLFAEVHDLSPAARHLLELLLKADAKETLSPDRAKAIAVLLEH